MSTMMMMGCNLESKSIASFNIVHGQLSRPCSIAGMKLKWQKQIQVLLRKLSKSALRVPVDLDGSLLDDRYDMYVTLVS